MGVSGGHITGKKQTGAFVNMLVATNILVAGFVVSMDHVLVTGGAVRMLFYFAIHAA
jgi:hypothetical protein